MQQVSQILWMLIVFSCVGCDRQQTKGEFNLDALTGKWVAESGNSQQFEEWRKADTETYNGVGYVIEVGDTTFFETLELVKVDGIWTYLAKVNAANQGEAIPFKLSRQSSERIEFRNDGHDFPKKIGYEFVSDNELQAYIEGPRDGQTIRILFDFKRCE